MLFNNGYKRSTIGRQLGSVRQAAIPLVLRCKYTDNIHTNNKWIVKMS